MVSEKDYILKYAGDKKAAQKLGAFYTPPELGRRMVGKVSVSLVGKKCLDNCCGYGNLLLQVLDEKVRQGEDPTRALTEVYGNEFAAENLLVCVRNLKVWARIHGAKWIGAVMNAHFHTGDALTDEAYEFDDPDVDVESAEDENDIEETLRREGETRRESPEIEKPQAKPVLAKERAGEAERKSEKVEAKKAEAKKAETKKAGVKTATFSLRDGEFAVECGGKTVSRRGFGQKFCRTAVATLNALKSKNVTVRATAETIRAWEFRLAQFDLACECELVPAEAKS